MAAMMGGEYSKLPEIRKRRVAMMLLSEQYSTVEKEIAVLHIHLSRSW